MKGYYRHKKGNIYRVLYEAKHSETGEALVVYQAMYGKGEIWVRPKDMFFEEGRFERIYDEEAQNLIPIELNSKYRFPDIEYTPIKVPLIDAGTFSKNVKAMITLLGKKGIVREELFNELNIKNDDDLEDYIIRQIKAYKSEESPEEIFHMIQIWGGSSGRGIYLFGDAFKWENIAIPYQNLVKVCLSTTEITKDSIIKLVEVVREFNDSVKNINVAFITKHTRYWLYRTLAENALPIYDSIMAKYVMRRTASIKDLQEYWEVMIAKANKLGIGLVPLERHIFKYAYKEPNDRKNIT